jgi:hypothetical protein
MLTVSFARIRPEKEQTLRDWLVELNSHQMEARASMAQEGTRHEQTYVLSTAEGPILVHVMESPDASHAYTAYGKSKLMIDEKHRAVLAESVVESLDLVPLYECFNPAAG